ncbi:uncharacterized protein [Amphiura filiformis]|uniref:uncharacterized protein n=1 Tax=Amphiura filiformis TaxID=82378 RepID=UPI003B2162CE
MTSGVGNYSNPTNTLRVPLDAGVITITCRVYGQTPVNGPPKWYKDNNYLLPAFHNINERIPGREFDFTFNVESSSYGDYRCVSENGDGLIRLEVKIGVVMSLTEGAGNVTRGIDAKLDRVTVHSREDITLTCTIEDLPLSSPLIIWQRNGKKLFSSLSGRNLNQGDLGYGRLNFGEDRQNRRWTLMLNDVVKEDEGVYTCLLGPSYGKAAITLLVTEPPNSGVEIRLVEEATGVVRTVNPTNRTLKVDLNVGTVTLLCRAPSWSKSVTWTENGQEVSNSVAYEQEELIPGWEWSLSFEFSDFNDGMYSCRTSGGDIGRVNLEATVGVRIELTSGRGTKTVGGGYQNGDILTVPEGETITLTCTVSYLPFSPYLIWRREPYSRLYTSPSGSRLLISSDPLYGKLTLTDDESMKQWNLTLEGVSKETQYPFSCELFGYGKALVDLVVVDASQFAPESTPAPSADPLETDGIEITLTSGHGKVSYGRHQESPIKQFEIEFGATVSMTCSLFIQADPFLFVMWHKHKNVVSINGEVVKQSSRLTVEEDMDRMQWRLTVKDVQDSDDGLWTCTSTTDNMKTSINMIVRGGSSPSNDESDTRDPIDISLYKGRGILIPGDRIDQLTAYTGDTITIACRILIDLSDNIVVTWQKAKSIVSVNGASLSGDERLDPEEDEETNTWMLTITEVSDRDDGVWTCSSTVNGLSASINLAVIDFIEITLDEGRGSVNPRADVPIVTAYTGDDISLSCRIFADISEYTIITWQKENAVSYNGDLMQQFNGSLTIEENKELKEWKLKIMNVSAENQGKWTCTTNIHSLSTSIDLVVIDRRQMDFGGFGISGNMAISLTEGRGQVHLVQVPDGGIITNMQVISGDVIAMTCNITLEDTDENMGEMVVVWKKENDTISVGDALTSFKYNERVVISANPTRTEWTLTLRNVTKSDEGQWMCIYQKGGTAYANLTVDETPFGVMIKFNGSTSNKEGGTIEIPLGKPFTLTCVANPDIPTDNIYYVLWYQENELVSYDERITRDQDNGRLSVEQDIEKHEWRLTIKRSSEGDLGTWKCVMETGYGRESSIAAVNVTAEVVACEPISEDNINLCHGVLPYDVTVVPNLLGHTNQADIYEALNAVLEEFDCPLRELACSMFIPPCKVIGSVKAPILPCRSVCETAKAKCDSLVWAAIPEFDCDRLPHNIDEYKRCWEPSNAVFGDSLPCEKVPTPMCQELGFYHTRFPNAHKHRSAEQVMRELEDEDLQALIKSGCSSEIPSFVCAAFYPQCDNGVTSDPCHEVCRRVWKDCKATAFELNMAKPEVFSCGKRYQQSGESSMCLMNISPPTDKPIVTSIERMRTSARFGIRSDDDDVNSYVVSAYQIKEPESLRHPISSSTIQTIPAKIVFAAGGATQPNIVIGDQSIPGARPLDENENYVVVVQAKNRYGLGPMEIVRIGKYNDEISKQSGTDGNLTYLRVGNGLNQIICISLRRGSDESVYAPYWTDDNGIIIRESGFPTARSEILSNQISLLDVLEDAEGPFTCKSGMANQYTVTADLKNQGQCLHSESLLCKAYSNYTILPNYYGHVSLQDAELSSYVFIPLLQSNCSQTALLRQIVCSLHFPSSSCTNGGSSGSIVSPVILQPCKEVCDIVMEECGPYIEDLEFQWPREVTCDKLPSVYEGLCDTYGEDIGFGPDNGFSPDAPVIVTVTNSTGYIMTNETDGFKVSTGSSVTFTCKIQQKDAGIQQWSFNGVGISYNGDVLTNHDRRTLSNEMQGTSYLNHLAINNVQVGDEGSMFVNLRSIKLKLDYFLTSVKKEPIHMNNEQRVAFSAFVVNISDKLRKMDMADRNRINPARSNSSGGDIRNNCVVKPRRYDITDRGMDCFFRGWVDVQGQGAPNDFCRISSKNGRNFLSCALAGTAGASEYNYNSTNAGTDWFEVGHTDSWYMRDENGDGRDDYCRCIGSAPHTEVSCIRAGRSGFSGHRDFMPANANKPCHFIRVDPFFGPP